MTNRLELENCPLLISLRLDAFWVVTLECLPSHIVSLTDAELTSPIQDPENDHLAAPPRP